MYSRSIVVTLDILVIIDGREGAGMIRLKRDGRTMGDQRSRVGLTGSFAVGFSSPILRISLGILQQPW